MENVRISDFRGFALSLFLPLFDFPCGSALVPPSFSLSIFPRCLSSRELFSCLFSLFLMFTSFLFSLSPILFLFFVPFSVSILKIKYRKRHCYCARLSHDDLVSAFTVDNLFQVADAIRSFALAHVMFLSQLFLAPVFSYHVFFFIPSQFRLYRSRFAVRFLFIFVRHYYSLELSPCNSI